MLCVLIVVYVIIFETVFLKHYKQVYVLSINTFFFYTIIPLFIILILAQSIIFWPTWSRIGISVRFNVEYASMVCTFFLAEYGSIILMSLLTVIMFLGGWLSISIPFYIWPIFLVKKVHLIFYLSYVNVM